MHHTIPGRGIGLTYDDPRSVPAKDLRYLAGVAVPDTWRPCDKNLVARHFFNGGAYALRRHQGPYSEVDSLISRNREGWEPHHGLEFDESRPIVTLYWSDIRSVAPADQIADICLPVLEKAGASAAK